MPYAHYRKLVIFLRENHGKSRLGMRLSINAPRLVQVKFESYLIWLRADTNVASSCFVRWSCWCLMPAWAIRKSLGRYGFRRKWLVRWKRAWLQASIRVTGRRRRIKKESVDPLIFARKRSDLRRDVIEEQNTEEYWLYSYRPCNHWPHSCSLRG